MKSWGQSHLWEERQLAPTVGKQEQEAAVRVSSTRSAHKERFPGLGFFSFICG